MNYSAPTGISVNLIIIIIYLIIVWDKPNQPDPKHNQVQILTNAVLHFQEMHDPAFSSFPVYQSIGLPK